MITTIALYSHDSVGLGHARRNRALAHALAEHLPQLTGQPVRGLLIAGNPDVARDSLPPGWDWLVLPGVAPAGAGHHAPRHLGVSMRELAAVRGAVVDAALGELAPDLLVVDRHPFGVAGELRSALQRQRERGCRTVLGLREVLDDPAVTTAEWGRLGGPDVVAAAYDAVWIYGDPSVYDPRLSGEVPPPLTGLATATGYLANGRPDASPTDHAPADHDPTDQDPTDQDLTAPTTGDGDSGSVGTVLTVLGGGSDGIELARVAARADVPPGHRHVLVTGPQMPPDDVAEVRAVAAPGTTVLTRVDRLPGMLRDAAAVVCMGGYNTLTEVMATDTPALVVPRDHRRSEQRRRAAALAAAGVVDTHPVATLTPQHVSAFLADAVGRRADRTGIDLDGLARVPQLAADLVRHRSRPSQPAHPSQFARTARVLVAGGQFHGHAG